MSSERIFSWNLWHFLAWSKILYCNKNVIIRLYIVLAAAEDYDEEEYATGNDKKFLAVRLLLNDRNELAWKI